MDIQVLKRTSNAVQNSSNPVSETVEIINLDNGSNMQNLLAKKYTFVANVTPGAVPYQIALGGANIFTNGSSSPAPFAVDSLGNNVVTLVTSPNFTTAGVGYLTPVPGLVQFANMLKENPHIVAGMRASYGAAIATAQSAFALNYFKTKRNKYRQSVPFTGEFTDAITISREDYNDNANDFLFNTPVILDGDSFLHYEVVGTGAVTIQIALLSAFELSNIEGNNDYVYLMKQIRQACFC